MTSIFKQLRETYGDTEARLLGETKPRPAGLLEIRSELLRASHHLDHGAEHLDRAGAAVDRLWTTYETTETDERARAVLAELQETADEIRLRLKAILEPLAG